MGHAATQAQSRRDDQLPVADINPAIELVAHFTKQGSLRESEFLVKRNAGVVGQGNAADRGMNARRAEKSQQLAVKRRTKTLANMSWPDVHRRFRGETI